MEKYCKNCAYFYGNTHNKTHFCSNIKVTEVVVYEDWGDECPYFIENKKDKNKV